MCASFLLPWDMMKSHFGHPAVWLWSSRSRCGTCSRWAIVLGSEPLTNVPFTNVPCCFLLRACSNSHLRPDRSCLRPSWSCLHPDRSCLRLDRSCLRLNRSCLRPDRSCLRPDRFCLRPDRFCLRPDRSCLRSVSTMLLACAARSGESNTKKREKSAGPTAATQYTQCTHNRYTRYTRCAHNN